MGFAWWTVLVRNGRDITINYKSLCQGWGDGKLGLGEGYSCNIYIFVLIEQVSTKTEEFLEQREGYWQAQLWTYEPYGFNAKKEFNSGRREFLS